MGTSAAESGRAGGRHPTNRRAGALVGQRTPVVVARTVRSSTAAPHARGPTRPPLRRPDRPSALTGTATTADRRGHRLRFTPRQLPEPHRPRSPQRHDVEFDSVCFGYDPARPVPRDVAFTLPERSLTALVGPSVAGKTTVARLLARFFDPDDGAVRIGGVDGRDVPAARRGGDAHQVGQALVGTRARRGHLPALIIGSDMLVPRPTASPVGGGRGPPVVRRPR
jgi:ABC transporter